MECFKIQNLTFTYPEQEIPVLRNVDLSLYPGDFTVLAGPSGCGKSTLLRQLKTVLAPHGNKEGSILFHGTPLETVDERTQTAKIGFVLQDPDSQIVTDKVWHELAFGLESLGFENAAIRGRVAEMASFFGIQTWFHMEVTQLSGGQKQLLNLASIMVLQPEVLILDEPTSQLDPIAATDFLQTLGRINRELGTTILICEHRLEDVIPMANRLIILDLGEVIADETPAGAFGILRKKNHPMLHSMPTPMQIWSAVGFGGECPLTVSEGRNQLTDWAEEHTLIQTPHRPAVEPKNNPILLLDEVWFRYEKDASDILKGVSMQAYPGELLCILGGNGTGKSTMLSILSGVREPYRGKLTSHAKKTAALPQNPQMLLVKKNVREELLSAFPGKKLHEAADKIGEMAALCRLEGLLDRHPYDLSGGEQQLLALARVLAQKPRLLLMDEPTKGLDADARHRLCGLLQTLKAQGMTLLIVTHDVTFAALCADRCAMLFRGQVVSEGKPKAFFAENLFYTTPVSRMTRGLLDGCLTVEDAAAALDERAGKEKVQGA